MKHYLFLTDNIRERIFTYNRIRNLICSFGLIFFVLMTNIPGYSQCSQSDIVITTNTTWTNQDVQLTDNQKITVTGATLTLVNCTLRRKTGCSGYWDGIHLVNAENGTQAGIVVKEGSRIEYSRRGIQALNGFSQITLDEAEMSDNGQMIRAMTNWPAADFLGNFSSSTNNSRDGDPVSVYDIGCNELLTSGPPKVIIRNNSILKVTENGDADIDPSKLIIQVQTLGAELNVINSQIINGQSRFGAAAIGSSRGKCKVYGGTKIDGFWIGIYKGTDAYALCNSEGLVLSGTQIINTISANIFGIPGLSVYNVSSNAMIRGNILEGNLWSFGTSYGYLIDNNIYDGDPEDTKAFSIAITAPRVSFSIHDNGLTAMPIEFARNNILTYATCNTWVNSNYAVIAGGDNLFPMSWGTASRSAGNVRDTNDSEMWNISTSDPNIDYYYRYSSTAETFDLFDGFTGHNTNFSNPTCTYDWPTNATELDTAEYERNIEDLEDEYLAIDSTITSIIGQMDTSVLSVKEELAYLKSRLSDLVGQGLLFHTTTDTEFWTEEVDPKVVELMGINYLWYTPDMFSITEHLDSNTDPDAEALYDAAVKMSEYFDYGKNLCNLSALQVDTLEAIAESSFGDYTNILRNYLLMMYDIFIPLEIQTPLNELLSRMPVQRPDDTPVNTASDFILAPNPFTDNVQIQAKSTTLDANTNISVYDLQGILLYSAIIDGNSGQINLSNLESGFYILKLENVTTGKIEIKRIYKNHR